MKSRLDTLKQIYSESTQSDLLEVIEQYEDLIIRCADREIEKFVKPVLVQLNTEKSLSEISDEGGWPYLRPLSQAGFLDHFFWARYQPHYDIYWQSAFLHAIRSACSHVVGSSKGWDEIQDDLFCEACFITEGSVQVPSSMERWATNRLFDRVHDLLRHGDMTMIYEYGVKRPDADNEDDVDHETENKEH